MSPQGLTRPQFQGVIFVLIMLFGLGLGWVWLSRSGTAAPTPNTSVAVTVSPSRLATTPTLLYTPTPVVAGVPTILAPQSSQDPPTQPPPFATWTLPPALYLTALPSPANSLVPYPLVLATPFLDAPTLSALTLTPELTATAVLTLGKPTPRPAHSLPPDWPDHYPGLTASKLSVHVIRNDDPLIMELVRRGHPRVLKAVDDMYWLAEAQRESPGTITIGRLHRQIANSYEDWPETRDPVQAAQEYVQLNMGEYRFNTGVDFWEGWNEFVPVTEARWKWYTAFEAERVCQMEAHGLRGAVGGFAAGTPEYNEMAWFIPALQAAHRCGGIFTLHEGVEPIIGCGVSATDPAVRIPNSPVFPGVPVGYMTVRYRYWYEGYLKPLGIGDLPLVISELGIGGIVPGSPCNGPGGPEWKTYQSWWVEQGVGPDGPRAFLNILIWYDQLMREDPYVLGATVFTAGGMAFDTWLPLDLHDVLSPMTDYLIQQH